MDKTNEAMAFKSVDHLTPIQRTINIINHEAVFRAFSDFECGKKEVVEISSKDIEIPFTETNPIDGFELPQGFPNCCVGHKEIFDIGNDLYKKFPNFCEGHERLLETNWFKKSNYSQSAFKLVSMVLYTFHCIDTYIDTPQWEKKIKDYIY